MWRLVTVTSRGDLRAVSVAFPRIRQLSSSSATSEAALVVNKKSSEEQSLPEPKSRNGWWQQAMSVWEESSGQVELDQLKQVVVDCSSRFDEAVASVQRGRRSMEEAQRAYDDVHKRHASLLMRREQWTKEEASSFVDVTAEEVSARNALQDARDSLRFAEENSGQCQRDYMDAIRRRYHEEQMWQDKWRVLGTYGTWALIGLNTLVFLGGQFFHQRREVMRLKAIEELIQEKVAVPTAVITVVEKEEEALAKETITSDRMEETKEVETVAQEQPFVAREPETKPLAEDGFIEQRSEEETSDVDPSSPSAVRQELKELWRATREKIANLRKEVGDAARQMEIKELHWPSAAIGATVTATGCILIVFLTGRR